MRADFKLQRLFVDQDLNCGTRLETVAKQSHYLAHVMRMRPGDELLVFNGRDGEWRASIESVGKKAVHLTLREQTRAQTPASDLTYAFAPLKQGRLDYMVQKATEMGAGVLQPVLTQHCQVRRLNGEKILLNAIEAAEQCGILTLPQYRSPIDLDSFLPQVPEGEHLIFCDEAVEANNPLAQLQSLERAPVTVLMGPEGGFSDAERTALLTRNSVTAIPLGPRILRADTAAVAALALIQATIGDW